MAAEQLTDKEIQFRKRARRRLVGAVALVLLMVTILPMVLDDRGTQKTPQPEIAISIPSQDAGFSSKIIPIAAAPAAPAKPEVQMRPPLESPQAANGASSASAPEKPKPLDAAKPAVKPPVEEKPAANESRKTPAPAKLAAAEKPAQTAPVEIKKTAEAKKEPEAKKGSVSVQVGVFSDPAKVKQMRSKLAEAGIQCYTENLNTPKGMKLRLRCGPYADRVQAQQALEKVKTAGFGGILVTSQ